MTGFTQELTRPAPAPVGREKPEDRDRLNHLMHDCGVTPVMFRCGHQPKDARWVPPEEARKTVWCAVCWEEQHNPCARCGK